MSERTGQPSERNGASHRYPQERLCERNGASHRWFGGNVSHRSLGLNVRHQEPAASALPLTKPTVAVIAEVTA